MKKRQLVAIVLSCLFLFSATSCDSLTGEQSQSDQFTEVIRGDLTVKVSSTGNIEVSEDRQLTFSSAGKIETIFVEEGDVVSAGETLAILDTDSLELAVAQAEAAVVQAQMTLEQAQVAVTQAELSVDQAQFAIDSAQYDLEYTESYHLWAEITAAQGEVADAEESLENTLTKLSLAPPGTASDEAWQKAVFYAELRLNTARGRLDAMLAGIDPEQIVLKKQQIVLNEQALEQQTTSLDLAVRSEEVARDSVELARQSLVLAEKQLSEAVIIAPFGGIITDVYVDENDTVSAAVPVLRLIDRSRMELNIDIDEVDIAQVSIGDEVAIDLDALPGLIMEGKVISIREIPKEEGGVILYGVKIEITVPEGAGVRNGMSANGDIILAKSLNTLIVPSRSVRLNSQGEDVVELVENADTKQTREQRVTIGIDDGFQAEIISGLQEGDLVVERR